VTMIRLGSQRIHTGFAIETAGVFSATGKSSLRGAGTFAARHRGLHLCRHGVL
jgi:hypothetical protein